MAEEKKPSLQMKQILTASFDLTKQKLPEIISSQAVYFIAVALVALINAYIQSDSIIITLVMAIQLTAGQSDPILLPTYFSLLCKFMVPASILYFLNRYMIDNLYVGMKTGAAAPRFRISLTNSNAWGLIKLDIKALTVTYLPALGFLIAITVLAAVIAVTKIDIPEAVKAIGLLLAVIYAFYLAVFRGLVLSAAQPSIYEAVKIPLMKGFYQFTKGYRWKIFCAKILIYCLVVIVFILLRLIIKVDMNNPQNLFQYILVNNMVLSLAFTLCALWDVHFNACLWKYLRAVIPQLNESASESLTPTA